MPAKLQGGKLNYRVTVQRNTQAVSGGYNEPQDTWVDLVTIWARRADLSDAEAYRAQEVGAQITTRFVVRYSSIAKTITPKDRLIFNGDYFNIVGIKEPVDTQRQWLEISAVARADK